MFLTNSASALIAPRLLRYFASNTARYGDGIRRAKSGQLFRASGFTFVFPRQISMICLGEAPMTFRKG
jgi:hypothetical protein